MFETTTVRREDSSSLGTDYVCCKPLLKIYGGKGQGGRMERLLVSTGKVGKAGDEWPLVVINRIASSYLKARHLILT